MCDHCVTWRDGTKLKWNKTFSVRYYKVLYLGNDISEAREIYSYHLLAKEENWPFQTFFKRSRTQELFSLESYSLMQKMRKEKSGKGMCVNGTGSITNYNVHLKTRKNGKGKGDGWEYFL